MNLTKPHEKMGKFLQSAQQIAEQCGITARFQPYVYGNGLQILAVERKQYGEYGNDLDRFLIELTEMADHDSFGLQLSLPHNDMTVKNTFIRFGFRPIEDSHHLQMERDPHQAITMSELELEPAMESAPPGKKAEDFIKKNKTAFKKRYGDRGEEVLYATAWKQFGESRMMESAPPGADAEEFIHKHKSEFKKRYGKKRGLRYLYATAWKKFGESRTFKHYLHLIETTTNLDINNTLHYQIQQTKGTTSPWEAVATVGTKEQAETFVDELPPGSYRIVPVKA